MGQGKQNIFFFPAHNTFESFLQLHVQYWIFKKKLNKILDITSLLIIFYYVKGKRLRYYRVFGIYFFFSAHLGGNIFSVFSTYLTKEFTSPIFGRYFIPRQKNASLARYNFAPQFDTSVQFSHSVMSDSLRPHGLQHARLPCPSPASKVCSNLCPLSQFDP